MDLFALLMGSYPEFITPAYIPPSTSYSVSATAPRILLNNTVIRDDLQAQLADTSNPNSFAARFKAFVDGEMANPGSGYLYRDSYAALIYKLTGNITYGNYAKQGALDYLVSEEARIAAFTSPASTRPLVASDSYLEIGPLLGDLCIVMDWCRDLFTAGERQRICAFANQSLQNLWFPTTAKWNGVDASSIQSGWSINDPANNYYYSFLEATAMAGLGMYGDQPEVAQGWLDHFRTVKIGGQLAPYFANNIPSGGSQEGTGYGVSLQGLMRVYFLWNYSTGEDIASLTDHARRSSYWLLHNITPDFKALAPTGDHARDSTAALYDYHRNLALALAAVYPEDPGAKALKAAFNTHYPRAASSFNRVYDYLYNDSTMLGGPLTDINTAFFGQSTSTFAVRSSWDTTATAFWQQLGVFNQSHAHQDQSSFTLRVGDTWLWDDANLRSSSGLVTKTPVHNMGTFYDSAVADTSPVGMQNSGVATPWVPLMVGGPETNVLAVHDSAQYAYTCADVTPVYGGNARVLKHQREVVYLKPGVLVVLDRMVSNNAAVHRQMSWNASTAPTIAGNVATLTKGGHTSTCRMIAPAGVPFAVEQFATVDVAGGQKDGQYYGFGERWPTASYRLYSSHATGTSTVYLHVVDVDGAVSSAVAHNAAGMTGVDIVLADGKTATVMFADASTGGTIDYKSSGGAVIAGPALPTSVSVPPLLAA